MSNLDPIAIIDRALIGFDGGRNWIQGATWRDGKGCLGGGLRNAMTPYTTARVVSFTAALESLPPRLRDALVATLVASCDRCAERPDSCFLVADHNDWHVRGYAEVAAVLLATKAALVGAAAEREAVPHA